MNKQLKQWLVMLAALVLASCVDEEREFTLNPDGSGKVKVVATFSTDSVISFNGESDSPEKRAKDAVKATLEDSRGVMTWADVSYEVLEGKKVKFEGTAYFPDINKLRIKVGSTKLDTFQPEMVTQDGVVTITCPAKDKSEGGDGDVGIKIGPTGGDADQPEWSTLSKEGQDARLAEVKAELSKMRMMIAGLAADMSNRVVFHLPADPQGVTNFEKSGERTLRVEQSGEQLLAAVDKLLADDEQLRGLLASGHNVMKDGPPAELMLGAKGDPTLRFAANAQPQFDYAKEQEAAATAFPQMMKDLGLVVVMAPPMKDGAKLENVRLAGVQMATKQVDRNLRPFNRSQGMSLAFVAELPGSVFSAGEGKLTRFVMEGGEDMMPESEWSRKPKNIEVSEDGKWLKFEVQADKLPTNAITVKELAGEIECMSSGGSEWLDLGFASLKEGAKGNLYNAEVKKVGEHSYNEGKYEVSVFFELEREVIKDVKFYDADGMEIPTSQNGASWGGKQTTLDFTFDEYPPVNAKVKAEIYTDLLRINVPFQLENVVIIPEEAE
ncbi:hypothetical protein [Sulfuriroseicoccus oceanibius]|uniref:Lipoprotein n=1 Tax=Sulfuriroseicoccus oceanibius TaxID=2707525 RepID=A0A6B3L6N3_9BACT|nr:hypothetical protein [Sulfuriroseicoccus oceanibius]QQL45507.1 hypothetical protein G3M56_002645 [Sulfuriroseicoccus oceanibius]